MNRYVAARKKRSSAGLDLFDQASLCWEKGKIQTAFRLFRKGASRGDPGCALAVGYFYDEGLGVGRSIPKAQLWYRRAYRAGNAAAAVNLGLLCKGRGDYAGARRWFRKALLSGDDDGALELAKTYVGKQATARAIPYLRVARRSKRVSEATREEATRLLESLQAVVRTDNGGRW